MHWNHQNNISARLCECSHPNPTDLGGPSSPSDTSPVALTIVPACFAHKSFLGSKQGTSELHKLDKNADGSQSFPALNVEAPQQCNHAIGYAGLTWIRIWIGNAIRSDVPCFSPLTMPLSTCIRSHSCESWTTNSKSHRSQYPDSDSCWTNLVSVTQRLAFTVYIYFPCSIHVPVKSSLKINEIWSTMSIGFHFKKSDQQCQLHVIGILSQPAVFVLSAALEGQRPAVVQHRRRARQRRGGALGLDQEGPAHGGLPTGLQRQAP